MAISARLIVAESTTCEGVEGKLKLKPTKSGTFLNGEAFLCYGPIQKHE